MSNGAIEEFQKGMTASLDLLATPRRSQPGRSRTLEGEINYWWSRVSAAADGARHDELENAAVALYAHPDFDPSVEQEMSGMAEASFIGPDDAEEIFTRAKQQERANSHATEEPPADDRPPVESPDEFAVVPATIDVRPATIVPAALTTPSAWLQEAPPPIDWLAAGRIPRGDVTTLSGDGGAGKTDIALQLAANVARGAVDWLGHEIANGRVVLVSGEEPERDIKRRLWLHSARDGYTFADLGALHAWYPDKTADAVLAVPEHRTGIMRPTRLMHEISAAIEAIAPVLVIVDNVAATFAGNQNDRVMVRSYVNLWRSIARGQNRPAVLLLDHPSLSGLTGGTGRGGNMDWRNAVRSALYLKPAEDRVEADQGIRILETVKSNYGPPGRPMRLCWNDGGLALEHAPTSLHRAAKDQECEETFLRLMDERNAQGRHVSDKSGKNYAPSVFADHAGAGGFTRQAFAKAMERLFQAKRISLRTIRVDGHSRQCLDRAT